MSTKNLDKLYNPQSVTDQLDKAGRIVKPRKPYGKRLMIIFNSSVSTIDYQIVLQHCQQNDGVDCFWVLSPPLTEIDSNKTAQPITSTAKPTPQIPVIFCTFSKSPAVSSNGTPLYNSPENAVKSFCYAYRYDHNLKLFQEGPEKFTRKSASRPEEGNPAIFSYAERNRYTFDAEETGNVLQSHDIPIVEKIIADKLEELPVRFSYLIIDYPQIDKIDLDPPIVAKNHCFVRKSKIRRERNPPSEDYQADDNLCPPHMSRRPYPVKFVKDVPLKNGLPIRIRPIRSEDEPALQRFFKTLSADSVYFRFGQHRIKVLHSLIHRLCQVDYDRDLAFLAVVGGEQEIVVGDARLNRLADPECAELSFIVADQWQGKGVGNLLMEFCIEVARETGLKTLFMEVMKRNERMMRFGWKYNFTPYQSSEDSDMEELRLRLDYAPRPADFFARKVWEFVKEAKNPIVDRRQMIVFDNKPCPVLSGPGTVNA